MTMTDMPAEPLGAGKLTGDSVSLVFGNLRTLLPIAMIPSALGVALGYIVSGPLSLNTGAAVFDQDAVLQAQAGTSPAEMLFLTLVGMVIWAFAAAAITRAAYDLKVNGSTSAGDAMRMGLQFIVPISLLFVVVTLIGAVASVLLVLPGLYVMAMWFVAVPAVVVDGAGFGALGRSFALTKGYRWPMAGYAILFILLYAAILVALAAVQAVFAGMGALGLALSAVVATASYALYYCIGSTMAALAYARLREIKEGMGLDQIADVFS